MTMTQLSPSQIRSPSPPASSQRRAAALETFAETRSHLPALGKTHTHLTRSAPSPQAQTSNPGASARNTDRPALAAAFKSP
jgi:hypothetical protein